MHPLRVSALLLTTALALPPAALRAETGTWTRGAILMEGAQFDAVAHPSGAVVAFGARTVWIDDDGRVLRHEDRGDGRSSPMDMPPALSVDDEGGLHAVSRDGGGWEGGHHIHYHYRSPAGGWDEPLPVRPPRKRNYGVAVAGLGPRRALVAVTEAGENVWGQVHFHLVADGVATPEGSLGGAWRSDNRIEMVRSGAWVYFAAGRNDRDGAATLCGVAVEGPDLVSRLHASRVELKPPAAGQARRGFPALSPDGRGGVDVAVGTQVGRLYVGRSSPGRPLAEEGLGLAFDDLGAWHLSIGRGAVATSADGRGALVVAFRSAGEKAGDGRLVARYSADGGRSFAAEMEVHAQALAGEGRTRVAVFPRAGGRFLVLFPTAEGVAAAVFTPAEGGGREGGGVRPRRGTGDDRSVGP